MNYWLIAYPREDMEHCIKIGTFGLGRKWILGHVKEGDGIVCVATKGDWKVIALGVATSDYYVDASQIFKKNGVFPDRFNLKASPLLENEFDLKQIMADLSFVTKIEYWPVYFKSSVAKLDVHDWKLLTDLANRNSMETN